MKHRITALVVGLAVMLLLAAVCPAGCVANEFRAFWVDAFHNGALNQADVTKLLGTPGDPTSLGDIRNANCNAIFLEVRKNADAYYKSNMGEPWATNLSPAGFDSLKAVLAAAHDTTGGKKRVEVHAWMVSFRTGGGVVYAAHHDTPTGSLTNLDNYWQTRVGSSTGAEYSTSNEYPFDAGHPLVEKYLTDVAMDIITNYDVDGIHFDYIRFTSSTQGYNPTSIARYNARWGTTGDPSSTNTNFQDWRREQIVNFMRRVYANVQRTKPSVLVSGSFYCGAPAPASSTHDAFKPTQPYKDFYSDWDSMVQEGIVDFGSPMTYFDLSGSYASSYTGWRNFQADRKANRGMVTGPGIYLNSLDDAITELQMTRDASPAGNHVDGFTGYSYACPYVTNGTYGTWDSFSPTLRSDVCPTWADVPDRPWKSNPTKGHICGTVTDLVTGKWVDGATVSIAGPETRSMRADGTGFYAFIDLTPGTYTVTSSYGSYPNAVKTVTVGLGEVTGNMYTVDFAMGEPLPPAITAVQATNITNNSAIIAWTTDQGSSSQVQYGLADSYGLTSPLDSNYVTTHSVALSGLAPNTIYHYRVISSSGNGTTNSVDYTISTSGVPTIFGVQASATATRATITWSTNAPADSKVNYGWTTAYYGEASDASLVTAHSLTLADLRPSMTYHYQCMSTNPYGTATSTDLTFTTPAAPAEFVVDDSDVRCATTGSGWTVSNPGAYPGGYNDNYRYVYNQKRTSSATATWTPNLLMSGPYDVYVWYTSGTNRSTAVKYTIKYSGGSTSKTINQRTDPTDVNGDKWVKIGAGLQFAAGTGGNVFMNNVTGETSNSYVVMVDAMKWVYTGPAGDTTEPSVPQSIVVTPTSTSSMNVSWAASTDDTAVAGYRVYRNGFVAGTSSTTNYSDSGLTANTQYSYTVSAYDAVPNESTQSAAVRKYTLSTPPTDSIVTCGTAAGSWSSSPSFAFQNLGFGSGNVSSYRSIWDNSASHSWTNDETAWTTTSQTCMAATTTQPYYFHVKGYNGDGVGNGTLDLGPFNYGATFATIADAMSNPDGTGVIIDTYEPITAVFDSAFYVEEADRTRALRVDATTALAIGKGVKVGGRLAGGTAQRSLVDAAILDSVDGTAPLPIFARIAVLGGASPAYTASVSGSTGAYNIGMLVRVAGTVKSHATGSFVIDDGSATVTVYSDKTVTDGSFVGVTGVCTLESGHAAIRSRSIDAVQVYSP